MATKQDISTKYGRYMIWYLLVVFLGGYVLTEVAPRLGAIVVLGGSALTGVAFGVLEYLDARMLSRHGANWQGYQYMFPIVTAVVPITALLYWYERRKKARSITAAADG